MTTAWLLVCLALLAGCTRPALHQQESYVFGTRVEVLVHGEDREKAREAAAAVHREFDRLHRKLHAWQPSELTRLNEAIATGATASLIAIVSAIGFMQNARYQREYDLGFDIRGSVIAYLNNQSEFDTYRNALQTNPSIVSMGGARSGVFSNRNHDPVKHESRQVEVDIIEVDDNYLNTMDLELLEGRDFRKDSETDQRESVIISEKMAKLFASYKPLGREIIW